MSEKLLKTKFGRVFLHILASLPARVGLWTACQKIVNIILSDSLPLEKLLTTLFIPHVYSVYNSVRFKLSGQILHKEVFWIS